MFTIKAKIVAVGEPQEVGRNAKTKQDLILEYDSQYPKKLVVTFWSDAVHTLKDLVKGTEVEVEFRVESREYNGRYFTNCNGKSVVPAGQGQGKAKGQGQGQGAPDIAPPGDIDDMDVSPF